MPPRGVAFHMLNATNHFMEGVNTGSCHEEDTGSCHEEDTSSCHEEDAQSELSNADSSRLQHFRDNRKFAAQARGVIPSFYSGKARLVPPRGIPRASNISEMTANLRLRPAAWNTNSALSGVGLRLQYLGFGVWGSRFQYLGRRV